MMKTMILALILALLPQLVNAKGPTCSSLFQVNNRTSNARSATPLKIDDLIQEGKAFMDWAASNKAVTGKKQKITQEDFTRIDEALGMYYETISLKKERFYELLVQIENSQSQGKKANEKSIMELSRLETEILLSTSGLLARIGETLALRGISYEVIPRQKEKIQTYAIRIARTGDHTFNKIANGSYKKYSLDLLIDPLSLLEFGMAGNFNVTNGPKIYLNPTIILSEFLLRDATALHEYVHNITYWQTTRFQFKPYHARIIVEKAPEQIERSLGNYRNFSIDELSAYRMSTRTHINRAILYGMSSKEYLDNTYRKIQEDTEQVITFSELASKVFRKHREDLKARDRGFFGFAARSMMSDSAKTTDVKISENEVYQIFGKEYMTDRTIETSDFVYALNVAIAKKLSLAENKRPEEKIRTLRQIARVLSLKSVKKLDGNYPTHEQILELLEGNGN